MSLPSHAVDHPSAACSWRSPDLGRERTVDVAHGRVSYFERGRGRVIVFAHGWLANANLWRKVVGALDDRFRCITLDLPFGSHRTPLHPDADLTPPGCGRLLSSVLAALDLAEVTLVGNDSGGAYSQIAVAATPERIARLVLTSCETPRDEFPPPQFAVLKIVAATAAGLREAMQLLRDPAFRYDPRAYGLLVKRPIDDQVWNSYALPCLYDDAILHDASKAMRSAAAQHVQAAARQLIESFSRPVLFAWSPEDPVFPFANAELYAGEMHDARLERIADAFSFTPEDQPGALANAIAHFVAS